MLKDLLDTELKIQRLSQDFEKIERAEFCVTFRKEKKTHIC